MNTEIEFTKDRFYRNKFIESDGDQRKTWQVINELTCYRTGKSPIVEVMLDGVLLTKSSDLSNASSGGTTHFGVRDTRVKLLLGYGIRVKKSARDIPTNIVGYRIPGRLCILDTGYQVWPFGTQKYSLGYGIPCIKKWVVPPPEKLKPAVSMCN